jgi:integrase
MMFSAARYDAGHSILFAVTGEAPNDVKAALRWARRASLPMAALEDDRNIRRVLDALAQRLDGTAAAPDYFRWRRRVLYNVLGYAVAEKRLSRNPLDVTSWSRPSMDEITEEINPRVVASPEQVRDLLAAVSYIGPRRGQRLGAFFACLYYCMPRPSEASGLTKDDCLLPDTGWGTSAGTRVAPDGRLFRSESGGVLHPSTYNRTWHEARNYGLSPAEAASLLARRPYDLRHGGVSLRLSAGVPATQVAEWAGHSVEVLLTIYAKCISRRDQVWFERIDKALRGE